MPTFFLNILNDIRRNFITISVNYLKIYHHKMFLLRNSRLIIKILYFQKYNIFCENRNTLSLEQYLKYENIYFSGDKVILI